MSQITRLFHRDNNHASPVAVAGEGSFLFDTSGRRYLDASGGAAVSCLGHGNLRVANAMKAQIDRLSYAHTSFFTTDVAEALADQLVGKSSGKLARALFVSGGSEAVEAALKLARQFHVENGEASRHVVISRRQSYHGNTLGALSVSDNAKRQEIYKDYLFNVPKVSAAYCYRGQGPGESAEAYAARLAEEFESQVLRIGPSKISAFIAETVTGATLGAAPAPADYFVRISDICKKYGILLILDEVMCGMGRTGTLYAFENENVAPDIVCCAKGLGAGYQPIGAVMMSQRLADVLLSGSGLLRNGHTYMSHPVACAAALEVQKIIDEENLLENIAVQSKRLLGGLHQTFGQNPHVGDIRGRGFLIGLELVRDRESKQPFDPEIRLAGQVKSVAQDLGLICYPGSGTIDGDRGDHILIAPAYTMTADEIDLLVLMLEGALKRVFDKVQ